MPKQSPRCPLALMVTAGLMLTGWCTSAIAQSQSDNAPSVAEAARRAREQKKNSAKPVRTLTNDNLPPEPAAGPGTTGSPPTSGSADDQAPGSATAEPTTPVANVDAAPATPPAGDESAKQKKAENAAKLERRRKELTQAQGELDVMQRKAALDSDSYYSKTDFASDKDGKAALEAEAQQISGKKQAVEALKAKVAELEALVGEPATAPADKDKPQP